MTQQELDELKKLCDAATPGPWKIFEDNMYWTVSQIDEHNDGVENIMGGAYDRSKCPTKDNVKFICTARTALPKLIAEVERTNKWFNDFMITNMRERPKEEKKTRTVKLYAYYEFFTLSGSQLFWLDSEFKSDSKRVPSEDKVIEIEED